MSRAQFGILLTLVVLIVAVGRLRARAHAHRRRRARRELVGHLVHRQHPADHHLGREGLTTPTFVAVVASSGDEATAQALAAELTERGYDSGVLHSDDHASLEPGFWVAYTGPFPDAAAAQAGADQLKGDGYTSAYPRCVGTAEQCA